MSEHLEITREQLGKSCRYYPKLAKISGGIAAGIFLGYLLEKSKSCDWINADLQDIECDTGLSLQEQKTVRKCLKNRNFLQERIINNCLSFTLNIQEIQEKLTVFEELIFVQQEGKINNFQETNLLEKYSEKIASDRFFPSSRKPTVLTITPHYRFEGPWHSQDQFEAFQRALLEYHKIQGLDNPMGYVFRTIDGMTKGMISPFWEEFVAGKPLGSSQKIQQEWEIKVGVPYPAFVEEIIQYYIHKGEPIEAATVKAHRELKNIDRAKSWWEGFLRKCDRIADEAIKAKELGIQTPYLPPSFSIKNRVDKQQVIEKLLLVQDRSSLQIESYAETSLSQSDPAQLSETSKIESDAPSLSILQKAYDTKIGRKFIARQIATHPEWGYQIVDDRIIDLYPF